MHNKSINLDDVSGEIIGQILSYSQDEQNEIIEAVARKLTTARDREAEDLEQKAQQLRSSTHNLKNRLSLIYQK